MVARGTEGFLPSVPFRLDLLRHGEALPAAADGDSARRLSPSGRATIASLAERFAREGWRPDALWASPLARAQETASILAAVACPGTLIGILEALVPDREPEDVVRALAEVRPRGHVVLVGHQPLLGRLAAYLSGGRESGFPAGGLVRLEMEDGLGRGVGKVVLQLRPDPV